MEIVASFLEVTGDARDLQQAFSLILHVCEFTRKLSLIQLIFCAHLNESSWFTEVMRSEGVFKGK